jgi:hypothetical protein
MLMCSLFPDPGRLQARGFPAASNRATIDASTAAALRAAGRDHDLVRACSIARRRRSYQGGPTLHDPLRIELADPDLAESLRRELSLFHAEIVQLDGHAEIEVELITGNPEARITSTLHLIDHWLARTGTPSVRVHLDGHAYTLSAPR